MRILTVYTAKSLQGGPSDFKPVHVQALQKQIAKFAPFAYFQCLTDVKVEGVDCIPLRRGWPGWWSKMELFDPALPGDFLFMDLDTALVGPLDDILAVKKLTMLRDFYRDGRKLKEGLGGGLFYFPAGDARRPVWDFFSAHPSLQMKVYVRGDQHLFEKFYLRTADRWQDIVPSQVVSWKVHCAKGIPENARVICFHGSPRPWGVGQFLHLYR